MQKTKLVAITAFYWFLLLYILAALTWWFIALEKQNDVMMNVRIAELHPADPAYKTKLAAIYEIRQRKQTQYIGEGVTFLVLILVGAVFVYRSIFREIKYSRLQQNFMMAITHELKTPIAVAQLNLETMQKRKLDEEKQSRMLSSVLKEVNRLNELCDNILYTTQIDSGKRYFTTEQIHLSDLTEAFVAQIKQRYNSSQLISSIEPDIMVKGDEMALQLLFSNLIENAFKYGGKEKPVSIDLKTENQTACLTIADEGPGIPDEEKTRVFEKFYRIGNEATRTSKGTGLGLYLCKRIVIRHNGKIGIYNNQPTGTVVKVSLPLG